METAINNILLVEDNPADARLLFELLKAEDNKNFSVHHVDRIGSALIYLKDKKFDLLLLDLTLPDGRGLDSVRRIYTAAPQLPIIVLTGLEDNQLAVEAVKIGAQDYLVKDQVDGRLLIRAMRHAIERKKMEERLHHLATHDSLTNLPNRKLFQDRLKHATEKSIRNCKGKSDKTNIAVLLLDLDNFKDINDTMGHPQGDCLLQVVADSLQSTIRQSDTVARMGGDEFMLIFENVDGLEDAKGLGEKILSVFANPFQACDQTIFITASIGISLFPQDGEDFMALMQTADIAMYYAKRERNRYCFYQIIKGVL